MALPLAKQQSIFAWGGDIPSTPEGILARYLHLREISKKIHEEVLKCVSTDALLKSRAPARIGTREDIPSR